MPKPTLAEHRTQIRAHLAAISSTAIYDDAEIDQALRTALGLVGLYQPITRSVAKSVTAGQTVIDLSADCPAEAVTEVALPGAQGVTTEFRARGTEIILRTAVATAGNATIYYRAAPAISGSDVDWYDPRLRPAVVLYAAGSLILARAAEMAETDSYKAAQLAYAGSLLMRDALALLASPTDAAPRR